NAQGKTNLLESIYICSTGRSQRTRNESQLVKFGYDEAHIRTFVVRENTSDRIDVHIRKDERKGLAVNGLAVRKMADFFGNLNAVMFSPEDLKLVKGGPSERRRFMDMELCQLNKIYCHDLQSYYKVLKQRNNLLKTAYKDNSVNDMLDVWDEQLVQYGERIIEKRKIFVERLHEIAREIHFNITDKKEELTVEYKPNSETGSLADRLKYYRQRDIAFGATSCGPHKDDMLFFIDGNDTKSFGSQGQQRTASLSSKLAEIELIKSFIDEEPILLLDDVLSELDESRQYYLLENIGKIQTFITCTGIEDSISKYVRESSMYNVQNGEIVQIS
ncbi:MAG: DNA replication/repair protein RecF, partial [Clostridiales bacterium]|nr:DNA replication/repair protein RecF [Clostridiales bacterium]